MTRLFMTTSKVVDGLDCAGSHPSDTVKGLFFKAYAD